MNLRNVGLLYRKEMTDLLRDRRTIFTMMVLPAPHHADLDGRNALCTRAQPKGRASAEVSSRGERSGDAGSVFSLHCGLLGLRSLPLRMYARLLSSVRPMRVWRCCPTPALPRFESIRISRNKSGPRCSALALAEVLNWMRDERIRVELGRIGVKSDVANPLEVRPCKPG